MNASTSLLVLDFDDSLFPTTHGRESGWGDLDTVTTLSRNTAQARLSGVSRVIERILCQGRKAGACCILTAASRDWVLANVASFMPCLLPLFLIDEKAGAHRPLVEIMSAADHYGEAFPGDPFAWKLNMLDLLVQHWMSKIADNVARDNQARRLIVVSVGDADYERDATRQLVDKYQTDALARGVQLFGKTVKLVDEPRLEELSCQLDHLHAGIEPLLLFPMHLNAEFHRNQQG